MFSLCVNPAPPSDASSHSLRHQSLPRVFRDALRWRHHSVRRSLRHLVFRRPPSPPPPPHSLYAHHGLCLAPTKRPPTRSLFPNAPKSTYVHTSYSDASHPYPRSPSTSATSLSSCTDRDDPQSAPTPTCAAPCAAPPSPSRPAKYHVPQLEERWLLCSSDSIPTIISAEPLSDRGATSASDSPRSPRSVLRLFSKLPDVRDAPEVLRSDTHNSDPQPPSPQQQSAHGASLLLECAHHLSPPPSESEMPISAALAPDDHHHHQLNFTVPIVAAYPEDRQEKRSNAISLFGMFAPAGLPHGDHQTQANAIAILAAYAENDQDEEDAMADMDLSAVDNSPPLHAQTDAPLPVMHMDAESCKWVGNEQHFAQFDSIVAAVRDDPEPALRDAVFDVGEQLLQQWSEDGQRHNRQFANGFQDSGAADIRDVMNIFTEAQAPSSQQQEQWRAAPAVQPSSSRSPFP